MGVAVCGLLSRTQKGIAAMTNRDDQIRQNDPSMADGYQSSGSQRLVDDMAVFDVSGEKVGKVSGASGDYFTLEKGLLFTRDYYVPMSAVSRIDPDGVYLTVRKDDVKNRGWENPPVGGQQRQESFGERVRDTLDPNDEPRP
jgi:hypothetical protein